ncbi:hypothetical protein KAR91_17435 [Candidatus Pacearchaeota archaeon]|nr:hypothetical protein [Candidatus Pacearchaeota archaeon]
MSNEDKQRAEDQAKAQFEGIKEMVEAMTEASDNEEWTEHEEALTVIQEDPLSVEVRSDWHSPGSQDNGGISEFRILLCWGGPSVQIIGELDEYNQPCEAKIQYQDWFTGWTDYLPEDEDEILLDYCRQFYFGE